MLLTKNLYEINFKLPMWAIIMLIALPIIAYIDAVLLKQTSFYNYVITGGAELLLIFLGFMIGINTKYKGLDK